MSLVDLGKRLLESAKLGETEEVRILMTNGAPFTTDWLGTSPLHLAAQYGHTETAEVLLRGGISRDARTKVERTPLHLASQEGHRDIVELLIVQGAEIDAKDMLKMTPLHWATERGHYQVAKMLLQYKADGTTQNKFDKTPLDIAEDNQDEHLIQLLSKEVINPISIKKYSQSKPKFVQFSQPSVTLKAPLPIFIKSESSPSPVCTSRPSSVHIAAPLRTVSSANVLKNVTKSPTITKPVLLRANLASLQKVAATNASGRRVVLSDSEEGESNDPSSSTSVLATLAALAEATAPNSSISTAEALQWLEMNGITMLPTDNSTIVASAVEGGQTVSLTEAGKLALTWVKEHQSLNSDSMDVSSSMSDTNEDTAISSPSSTIPQKVITIVADQARIPSIVSSPQTPIVVLSSQLTDAMNYAPPTKKLKTNITLNKESKIISNGNSFSSSEEDEKLKLKKELEKMKREAELYKAQLVAKEYEAERYKRQLEQMRTQPKEVEQ